MALDFDGIDDEVNHGDIAGLDGAVAYTFMAWVFYTATGSFRDPFFAKMSGSVCTVFLCDDIDASDVTKIGGAVGDFATIRALGPAGSLVTGVWAHWAVVFDGSGAANADRFKIYKDAVNLTMSSFVGTFPAAAPDTGVAPLRFARNENDVRFADLNGAHIKGWLAALSASEIAAEMSSYRPVRTANLILDSPYDFDELDYSGQGNHGTATGAVRTQGPTTINYDGRVVLKGRRLPGSRRDPREGLQPGATAFPVGRPWYSVGRGR